MCVYMIIYIRMIICVHILSLCTHVYMCKYIFSMCQLHLFSSFISQFFV